MGRNLIFRSRSKSRVDWWLRVMFFALALYVAGGLYFGYIFVSIGIEMLELQTGADLPNPPASPLVAVAQAKPEPTAVQPLVVQPNVGGRLNILLLGLDQRPVENGQPSRSDTMIVLSLEPQTQTAAMLSIPRDLWVTIPKGNGEVINHKINTAHFWGQDWGYPDGKNLNGGPELAKRTVEYNLGIPIHYYARIDFKGFEKAVDLIDGIDIDVPHEIWDTEYPLENDTGVITIHFSAGLQHLNGQNTLRYARTRHADSDFGRMERQRQVLLAVRDKALRLDLLPRLPQLVGVMRDSFDTDLPLDQMMSLANLARTVKPESIVSRAIGADMVTPDEPIDGALLPKQAEIQKLITELFFDPLLKQEAATIEVQNGTTRDGLASDWANSLAQRAFQVVRFRQAETTNQAQTEIWHYASKDYTVQQLATVLHLSAAQIHKTTRPPGLEGIDIRIVLGKDAILP